MPDLAAFQKKRIARVERNDHKNGVDVMAGHKMTNKGMAMKKPGKMQKGGTIKKPGGMKKGGTVKMKQPSNKNSGLYGR